jgi:hypothetical protein
LKRSTAPPPEGPALGERLDVGPSRAAEAGQAGEEKSDRGKYATAPGGAPSCVGGFFPGFLADCKAIVHFVRQYRVDLKHCLNRLGQSAAASIVEGAKSPKFAHWRWTTLYETVKCVQAIYPVLQTNWENIQCKDKIRDQGPVNKVDSALRDPLFWPLLAFVMFLTQVLTRLQRWGTSCACHPEPRGKTRASGKGGRLQLQLFEYLGVYLIGGLFGAPASALPSCAPQPSSERSV